MSDKSELLEQLRIERPAAEESGGVSWVVWAIAIVVGVGVAGAIVWYAYPRAIPISVATAATVPSDVVVGPSSILDASGYVVARRQATVSSKITGKVVHPSCYGVGKAIAGRDFAAAHGIDLARSFFYTDSDEDLPLLDIVGRPRPINPSRALQAIAAKRGW